MKLCCENLIPGVPLTTRQLAKTCGYGVPRYHTHMSHISRPIPAYSIHNIQKYMIDYNYSLFTVPLIQKGVPVLVLLKYNTRQHMSHISRPIPAYSIHNIQKSMTDYNHSLFTVPLIKKGVHVLVLLKYNTRQKQNKKTKSCPTLIPYAVPYVGQPPTLDMYLKGGSHDG